MTVDEPLAPVPPPRPRTVLVAYRTTNDGRTVLLIDDEWEERSHGPGTGAGPGELPGLAERDVAILSPRERQVLDLIVQGMTARRAAEALGISSKTVEAHKSRIFRKLGVRTQAAAAGLARTSERPR